MSKKNKYPLRRIIKQTNGEYKGHHFAKLNLLECGHKVPVPSDIYGERTPVRQRCRLCYEEGNENNR